MSSLSKPRARLRRSVPVLGHSKLRQSKRGKNIQSSSPIGRCCARGRAHSGVALHPAVSTLRVKTTLKAGEKARRKYQAKFLVDRRPFTSLRSLRLACCKPLQQLAVDAAEATIAEDTNNFARFHLLAQVIDDSVHGGQVLGRFPLCGDVLHQPCRV
jgi:hypothetical protein